MRIWPITIVPPSRSYDEIKDCLELEFLNFGRNGGYLGMELRLGCDFGKSSVLKLFATILESELGKVASFITVLEGFFQSFSNDTCQP